MPSKSSSNGKVTLAKLGQMIENIHDDVKEIKTDVRENTEFRIAANAHVRGIKFTIGSGWVLAFLLMLLQIVGVL